MSLANDFVRIIRKASYGSRQFSLLFWRKKKENIDDIEKLPDTPVFAELTKEELERAEQEVTKKMHISTLNKSHRNILFGQMPYEVPLIHYHKSLFYQRKMFAKYGDQSELTPVICWPNEEELRSKQYYEKVAYPFTVSEVMREHRERVAAEELRRRERQQQVLNNMAKSEQWKRDLKDRIAKKEAQAIEAKLQKEKLIEEVRQHFGYKIDTHDEKFQELLEKKQKEDRKKKRDLKKKAREQKLMAELEAQLAQGKKERENATKNEDVQTDSSSQLRSD